MIEAERLALEESRTTGAYVELTLDECWYTCCSKGWSLRPARETYICRISTLGDEELLAMRDGAGALTFALTARLDAVVSVRTADVK